ncbi:MAG: fatty acid desaturase [Bacteroidota bacterium]
MACWAGLLVFSLSLEIDYRNPLTYVLVILQAHLYTGLFITAHDAMHGVVAPGNTKLNHALGRISSTLFMFNDYSILLPKHHEHHRFVASEDDPDYHGGNPNFFLWFFKFAWEYVRIKQILFAAISYNLLKLVLPMENLILFWIVPSFLSMMQLFYFGTYLPHRGEHEAGNRHRSRSQKVNHLWAFISCYFFGYHYEHHESPATPWWLLWHRKEERTAQGLI